MRHTEHGTALERLESTRDVFASANFDNRYLKTHRLGRGLDVADLDHASGIAGIGQYRQSTRPGTTSRRSSTRLPARSACWLERPVALPVGRSKLGTRPVLTGSLTLANTIGITEVACRAASVAGVPTVTMTSALIR